MKYVRQKVSDWNVPEESRKINTFQLEEGDLGKYSGRLFGFSHGTGPVGFREILNSGRIMSSFNIRANQAADGRHTTGSDRDNNGQYTAYFRFVERKKDRKTGCVASTDCTDNGIPAAIVRSLGGVGGGSGYVFFATLERMVRSGACFALAGGFDGKGGGTCFTNGRLEQAEENFYTEKRNYNKKKKEGTLSKFEKSEAKDRMYAGEFCPTYYGERQFELGIAAAEQNARGNEIGFFDSVPLECIEVIMVYDGQCRNIPNYNFIGNYKKGKTGKTWKVFLRNDSTLNIAPQAQLPQLSPVSQASQPSLTSQTAQSAQEGLPSLTSQTAQSAQEGLPSLTSQTAQSAQEGLPSLTSRETSVSQPSKPSEQSLITKAQQSLLPKRQQQTKAQQSLLPKRQGRQATRAPQPQQETQRQHKICVPNKNRKGRFQPFK